MTFIVIRVSSKYIHIIGAPISASALRRFAIFVIKLRAFSFDGNVPPIISLLFWNTDLIESKIIDTLMRFLDSSEVSARSWASGQR